MSKQSLHEVQLESKYKKPNPRLETLTKKSTVKQLYKGAATSASINALSGRNSQMSMQMSPNASGTGNVGNPIPEDLAMVMDSSDINFKKRKIFGISQRSGEVAKGKKNQEQP